MLSPRDYSSVHFHRFVQKNAFTNDSALLTGHAATSQSAFHRCHRFLSDWALVRSAAYFSCRCSSVLPVPLRRRLLLRACSAVSSSMSINSQLYSDDDDDDDDKGVLPVLLNNFTQTHKG